MAINPTFYDQFIPGLSQNTATASGNVGQLLKGAPSTANARNKSAYFGVNSGMPGSGLSNAYGYDLYGQEAEANKQRGFEDLLKMITSYSGTIAPTTGQLQQQSQFDQELAFKKQQSQLDRNAAQERLNASRRPRGGSRTYRKVRHVHHAGSNPVALNIIYGNRNRRRSARHSESRCRG